MRKNEDIKLSDYDPVLPQCTVLFPEAQLGKETHNLETDGVAEAARGCECAPQRPAPSEAGSSPSAARSTPAP